MSLLLSTKDVSSLFVSEITDLGQFTSISEPSKATSKASSKGSDSFLDEIIFAEGLYFKLGCLVIFASQMSPIFFELDIFESTKHQGDKKNQ